MPERIQPVESAAKKTRAEKERPPLRITLRQQFSMDEHTRVLSTGSRPMVYSLVVKFDPSVFKDIFFVHEAISRRVRMLGVPPDPYPQTYNQELGILACSFPTILHGKKYPLALLRASLKPEDIIEEVKKLEAERQAHSGET